VTVDPRTVRVGPNRVVGYYEFGDRAGRPVLALHGMPACGVGFVFADEEARRRGLRVLAPDRPGIGLTTFASWSVASYPALVAEFADALGVDRFAVWGYSGGGPYAVACAAVLPSRVTGAAVAAGSGQIGVWATAAESESTDRLLLAVAPRSPALARAYLSGANLVARVRPRTAVRSLAKELSETDRVVLDASTSPAEAMAPFTQAFLRGARGVVEDYRVAAGAWHVDLDAITAPVRIWHGDADTEVPLRHGLELARRIEGAEFVRWPGEGHLATVTHVAEILDWLGAL
jgi:pimeloyl-ACP methyl ester carboxylesterase